MSTHLDFASTPGMPQDRLARIAARQAFVGLKHECMAAAAGLPGPRGDWLRLRVRRAEDPAHLWRVRDALLAALPGSGTDQRTLHGTLRSGLAALFNDAPD